MSCRVVVKFGGNAMVDETLQRSFANDILGLLDMGVEPIVVHGGGPQIEAALDRAGLVSEFVGGQRVTTDEAFDVVRMVLAGSVQRELVNLLNALGVPAVGLTGEDARTLRCERLSRTIDGSPVDLGRVGSVVDVNPSLLNELLANELVPVVSSIGVTLDGLALNINADAAAGAIAGAVSADRLIMMTNVAGLCLNWPEAVDVVPRIESRHLRELLPSLAGGMIPKVAACLAALDAGVGSAVIADGRVPGAALNAIADVPPGTLIVGGDQR